MLLTLLGGAALVLLLVSYRRARKNRSQERKDLPDFVDADIESSRAADLKPR